MPHCMLVVVTETGSDLADVVANRVSSIPRIEVPSLENFISDVHYARTTFPKADQVSLAFLVHLVYDATIQAKLAFQTNVPKNTTPSEFVARVFAGSHGPKIIETKVYLYEENWELLVEVERRVQSGALPAACLPGSIHYLNARGFLKLDTDAKIRVLAGIVANGDTVKLQSVQRAAQYCGVLSACKKRKRARGPSIDEYCDMLDAI